jgi:hypothetical protein
MRALSIIGEPYETVAFAHRYFRKSQCSVRLLRDMVEYCAYLAQQMGRGEVNLVPKFRERNAIRASNDPRGTSIKRTTIKAPRWAFLLNQIPMNLI